MVVPELLVVFEGPMVSIVLMVSLVSMVPLGLGVTMVVLVFTFSMDSMVWRVPVNFEFSVNFAILSELC